MGDSLKYILLAVGGYLLYSKFVAGDAPTTVAATQNDTPPVVSTVPTLPSSLNLRSSVLNLAAKAGYTGNLNYDEWGYFYQQYRSVGGPGWEDAIANLAENDPRRSRGFKMSIDDYLAMTTPLGLSGLGAYTNANAWESANKRVM